jgi:aryl-alcohol dehydrogenase-like predicted oxidoreductase
MNITRTAFGTWSAGRYMHYGEHLDEARFIEVMRYAYEVGMRTFMTADVYGVGRADELLGEALSVFPRDSYAVIGMVGHDIYEGTREGSRGYARFTDAALRGPAGYGEYLEMATRKSLARCRLESFDLLLLHNPDERGYTHSAVWQGMEALKTRGLTRGLGLAPGPANGFTYDMIRCFAEYGELMDWAMIILNPLEPWPGGLVLPAAQKHGVDIMTRVVDYGGLFYGDVRPGHTFRPGDHRTHRPAGWVEHGWEKMAPMQAIAQRHGLSLIQFAALWNLAQPAVASVIPTYIQEAGDGALRIEDKIADVARLPMENPLTEDDLQQIARLGDNTGCMALKGASRRHATSERPDEWAMRDDLEPLTEPWGLHSVP